jgi:hypothetical protein
MPADHARPGTLRRYRRQVRDELARYRGFRSAFIGTNRAKNSYGIMSPEAERAFDRALEARESWHREASRLAYGLRIRDGIDSGALDRLGRPLAALEVER